MYIHIKSGQPFPDKQIREHFDFLRRSDDEFARDYARHEFGKWVSERYKHVPDGITYFQKHANAYNSLRKQMIQDYYSACQINSVKPKDVKHFTADELLAEFQAIELPVEKL